MTEQSVEIVEGLYAAFARGDVPAVLAAMADDIEWHQAEGMPYGGVHRGGDAVARNVFGNLTLEQSLRSLELMRTEVMPKLERL